MAEEQVLLWHQRVGQEADSIKERVSYRMNSLHLSLSLSMMIRYVNMSTYNKKCFH
jgi:hypothetical protein